MGDAVPGGAGLPEDGSGTVHEAEVARSEELKGASGVDDGG